MSVALACTWRPRGEVARLRRIRPLLENAYCALAFALPPDGDHAAAQGVADWPTLRLIASPRPYWGRYLALRACLDTAATHVHYADLDMLVHWIERDPAEWQRLPSRQWAIPERLGRRASTSIIGHHHREGATNDLERA